MFRRPPSAPAPALSIGTIKAYCDEQADWEASRKKSLGLTSFDSRKTADEIMRIGSERGENVVRLANSQAKIIDQSTNRGSGLSAVVNSIFFGDPCDVYVRCGVDSGN